jgi:hypothetical protein
MFATFVTSESFWGITKRGKHLCPNHLSEKKVRNVIHLAHSCTHLGSKLSSSCSWPLNYIIWYYKQNRENFKLTATDNILIYYKPICYDLLSKEYFASEILQTLHIHLAVGHIWRGFYFPQLLLTICNKMLITWSHLRNFVHFLVRLNIWRVERKYI